MHVPDLDDGRTCATLEEGMAYVDVVAFEQVAQRGVDAVDDLPRGPGARGHVAGGGAGDPDATALVLARVQELLTGLRGSG